MDNHDRVITNKVRIETLTNEFEEFKNHNHDDHQRIFETLDKVNERLARIETELTVKKEQEKKEMRLQMWLIGLFVSSVFTIVNWAVKYFRR